MVGVRDCFLSHSLQKTHLCWLVPSCFIWKDLNLLTGGLLRVTPKNWTDLDNRSLAGWAVRQKEGVVEGVCKLQNADCSERQKEHSVQGADTINQCESQTFLGSLCMTLTSVVTFTVPQARIHLGWLTGASHWLYISVCGVGECMFKKKKKGTV